MYIILNLLLTPIKACLSLILFLFDCVYTYVSIYHVYIDCNCNNFHKKNKVELAARGSIPGRNGVFIELHVFRKGQ